MTLHLLRHGLAESAEGRCLGRTDVPLAAGGQAAFERVAARWPHARPGHLVASPLARARDSAAVLARIWGLPVEVDARLAELDFGRWEGRPWADVEADDGDALDAWMRDWARVPAPGGEGFPNLLARVDAWLADLGAAEASSDSEASSGSIVAVAHAGPIRAVLVRVLGLDPAHAFRLDVAHGALTTVRLRPPALACLNHPL